MIKRKSGKRRSGEIFNASASQLCSVYQLLLNNVADREARKGFIGRWNHSNRLWCELFEKVPVNQALPFHFN